MDDDGFEFIARGLEKLEDGDELLPKANNLLHSLLISRSLVRKMHDMNDDDFLRKLLNEWETYKGIVSRICRLESVAPVSSSLRCTGNNRFQIVFNRELSKAIKIVLGKITRDRDGELIDRVLMKRVTALFIDVDGGSKTYYRAKYEALLIEETTAYYTRHSAVLISKLCLGDYLRQAQECLSKERERADYYLQDVKGSRAKLEKSVHHELLAVHAARLLQSEALIDLFKGGDKRTLCNIYHLFPNNLDPVFEAFKQHVIHSGTILVQQVEKAATGKGANQSAEMKQVLSNVFELNDKCNSMLKDYFGNNILFHKALKEAFQNLCKKEIAGKPCSEHLAAYLHTLIHENSEIQDVQEELVKVCELLAYCYERDIFEGFYRMCLASRLLSDQADINLERTILEAMKLEISNSAELKGSISTEKMEVMVLDMTLARELQSRFSHILQNPNNTHGINLKVSVLKPERWQLRKEESSLNLPAEMADCVKVFKEFYDLEYNSQRRTRKLEWRHSLGTCTIIGNFEAQSIELVVSTYQAAVLLLFNGADRFSFAEIQNRLSLTNEDLEKSLHPLCGYSMFQILNKEPNTKTISGSDAFVFNPKFINSRRKIQIPREMVQTKEVAKAVLSSRRYAIDAAVVKIMKKCKTLEHEDLLAKCRENLKGSFELNSEEFENRIRDLIQREYIVREGKDKNFYRYVA